MQTPSTPSIPHMFGLQYVLDQVKKEGLENVLLTGGGIIPDEDMKVLSKIGVGKLFGPGTPVNETIKYIENWFNENRN